MTFKKENLNKDCTQLRQKFILSSKKHVAMRVVESDRIFTVEEYIQHELHAERRSDFINGQLYPMPGEKDINNEIAGFFYVLFLSLLKKRGYFVHINDIKVAIPGGTKYYYPDVFATKEMKTEQNQYIKYEPEIIVEVVSTSSQITDYVDKYIDYTKIPSLKYYLIVEPETSLISVYERTQNDHWEVRKFTKSSEIIELDKLDISFFLSEVYG